MAAPDRTGVLCIGEMMVEMAVTGSATAQLGYGGDTWNTAVYLARLGQPVGYLTALGSDAFSDGAMAALRDERIDTRAVIRAPGRTMGLYAIRTDAGGERSFTYWRGASPARDLFGSVFTEDHAAAMTRAALIYLSGITLWMCAGRGLERLIDALSVARAAGARVAFDGNYRPRLWAGDVAGARQATAAALAVSDICLATDEDEALLWGDRDADATLARLAAAGIPDVVLKQGAAGALVAHDGRVRHVPAVPVARVVDTTAAGDSFNAGYLDARLRGLDRDAAAAAGHRLAARVIAHPGAILPHDVMI